MPTATNNPLTITVDKNLVITPRFRREDTSAITIQGKGPGDVSAILTPGASTTKTFLVRRTNYTGPITVSFDTPTSLGVAISTPVTTLPASTELTQEFTVTLTAAANAPITTPATANQSIANVTVSAGTIPPATASIVFIVNRTSANYTVDVSFTNPAINVGQTTVANAVVRSSDGSVITGRSIVWSSSNISIATVSNQGLVTALAVGTVQIIATVSDLVATGQALLTVTTGGDGGSDSGTVTFNKNLNTDLVFNWTRGNTSAPPPISVRATNNSTTKTFNVVLTPSNTGIVISPSSFTLAPTTGRDFTISAPITLLNGLPDNQTVVNLTVSIT